MPKMFDGTFYTGEMDDNGNIKAKCTQCGGIKSGHVSSTGNFINHYKQHPDKLLELKLYNKKPNTGENVKPSSRQPTLNDIARLVKSDEV